MAIGDRIPNLLCENCGSPDYISFNEGITKGLSKADAQFIEYFRPVYRLCAHCNGSMIDYSIYAEAHLKAVAEKRMKH